MKIGLGVKGDFVANPDFLARPRFSGPLERVYGLRLRRRHGGPVLRAAVLN
ncbi:hypothetical protein Rcae01_05772 [Novipirellula caenicola]|uniref:Uncharacterized protein n=1 Tax=Novipirellula caenicola TaxID=1536901 RepID=A0ABP9W0E8_9BACT